MARERTDQPFAEEVKRLMDEKGLTMRGLAGLAGIDPGFFARVLQGKKPPSRNVLTQVARALDVPEDYFLESRINAVFEAMLSDKVLADQLYVAIDIDAIRKKKKGES